MALGPHFGHVCHIASYLLKFSSARILPYKIYFRMIRKSNTHEKCQLHFHSTKSIKYAARNILRKKSVSNVHMQTLFHATPSVNKIHTGVNFINILLETFSYKSALRSFFLIIVWLCNFL